MNNGLRLLTRRDIWAGVVRCAACALAGMSVIAATAAETAATEGAADSDVLPLHDGYVQDWLILTGVPFDVRPSDLEGPDFIDGESALRPREGQEVKSERLLAVKAALWRRVQARTNAVSFAAFGGGKPKTMNYALTYLAAPATMSNAWLEVASNKARYRVLVNGRAAAQGNAWRLGEAKNAVLFRVPDDKGDAWFSVRVVDGERHPLRDVNVSLDPDAAGQERRFRSTVEADNAFIVFPKSEKRISYVIGLMTPEAKAALGKAMTFLVNSQQPNGAWSDTTYPDSVGVSALCCMALLAEGNLPRVGPHGKSLDKGIDFLLSSFKEEGVFASKSVEGYGVMYGHALTLLTLLEVCGNMPWRPELDDRISKGLQTILACQRLDGGWRYELTTTGDSDISVTTTVLWVLGQARRYGYTVPRSSFEKAIAFVERCGRTDGRFAYRLNGREEVQPHSGIGVAALYGTGRLGHKLLPAARDLIALEYERYSVEDLAARRDLMYGSFFASLALYSAGYDCWSKWYPKFVGIARFVQKEDGQIMDQRGNKVYPTALTAIILQAPYGYLSIYVQ